MFTSHKRTHLTLVLLAFGLFLSTLIAHPGAAPLTSHRVEAALAQPGISFTSAGTMSTPRGYFTATLLQNGKVLVVGGDDSYSNGTMTAAVDLYDPASNTWSPTNRLSIARSGHTATLLPNGKVLIAGGFTSGFVPVASAEIYDPATGVWSAVGSMISSRARHTATLLRNGKVLVAGGGGGSDVSNVITDAELYNPATNTWSSAGSMNTPRRYSTATLLPDGRVLLAGGDATGSSSGSGTVASAEIYNPATNTWSQAASMNATRVAHCATLLPNGKVLVVGGYSPGFGVLSSAELYDPATNTWSAAGNLTTAARYEHTATLLPNGKVLVIGGFDVSGSYFHLPGAEIYDPAANAWTFVGNLNTARSIHTATLLPTGKILVAGGRTNEGTVASNRYIASAELYDATAGSWSAASSLATARFSHTMTLLPNGKVLMAGGADHFVYFASAELYDPATDTWSAAASLNRARQSHTATLLPNGKVLVAGGYDNSPVANAELYDPATNTGSPAGAMITGRHHHRATLLPNGKVLVTGGLNSSTGQPLTPLNSAELYDPATNAWSLAASMLAKRRTHEATLLPNGKALVAGGFDDTLNGGTSLASAELYDPATNTWSLAASMSIGRHFYTITLLPNGKVLAVGDYGTGSGGASAEVYDPSANTWSPVAGMNQARDFHTATLLPNGKVLVSGGASGVIGLTSSELYDPATNTWQVTGSLSSERFLHTAALLPDGRVIVGGGLANNTNPLPALNSAELYGVGLGFDNTWRPALANPPATLTIDNRLTLQGSLFQGISEASGGMTQGSATNYPLVQLRSLGNEQTTFLSPDPAVGWSATSFTSQKVKNIPPGHAMVTVFANAIPSLSHVMLVCAPIDITNHPNNQNVNAGVNVIFTAAASGVPAPTVQWQVSVDGGTNYANISGATGATLIVPSVTTAQDGYRYRAVFTSDCGSVATRAARLSVKKAKP